MPEIYTYNSDDVYVKVWEINEPPSFFEDALKGKLTDLSADVGRIKSEQHLMQFLASRYLVMTMMEGEDPIELYKSAYGKLHFSNSNIQISVSHTSIYVAVALSRCPVGIDLEATDRSVEKVQHKFVNDEENKWITGDSDRLLIWCCKEVVYKIYEQKEVDFKDHMYIFKDHTGSVSAQLRLPEIESDFNLTKINVKNLLLVWGFQK